MADRANDGLPYGHFGQALYDADEGVWTLERTPGQSIVLEILGDPKVVVGPADSGSIAIPDLPSNDGPPSQRHARQIQDLVKAHPEIQPASSLLSPLLRVSEALESATARHDPLKGSLLAVGSIPSETRHKSVQVAAFPHGPTGSDLRIGLMQRQRRGWDDSKDAWIEVPLPHGEEALWEGEGAPIQQICFAHSLERSDTHLGVRMPTRTVVFRPVLRSKPAHGSFSSRLDANPVFELPMSRSGDLPHADIAFNPWYTQQFAVIDQAGGWSVWELEGRTTLTGTRMCVGCTSDESTSKGKAVADGWARISWTCNPSTIAVCTRNHLALFTITENNASPTKVVVVSTEGAHGWILDMVLVQSHPMHICVLISERLLIYLVRSEGRDMLSAKTVTSLKHYRNPNDMTLSLSVIDDKSDIVILLRSSIDPMVVSFRIRIEAEERIVVFDPVELRLPGGIKGLHFADVALYIRPRADDSCVAIGYRDRGIRFYNLLYLREDLALTQQLYATATLALRGPETIQPTWEGGLGAKSSIKLRKESFVVDDDELDSSEAGHSRGRPTSSFVRHRRKQVPSRRGADWTISLELTARGLEHANVQQPCDEILHAIEDVLQRQSLEQMLPLRTLREFGQGEVSVIDVEESTTKLQDLAIVEASLTGKHDDYGDDAPPESGNRLVLRNLSKPCRPNLDPEHGDLSMSAIYDSMVKDWITSLPANVPGRTRLAKEQLVRRAAAEVALASRVIRIEDTVQQPLPEPKPSHQSWELPVRGGALPSSSQTLPPSSQYLDSSSQLQSQQSLLPTPSPSATPSVTTGSSHPSTFAAPEITRLSRYTTFSKPAPSALPRSLTNILSHWTLGADPANYDWLSTSRRIAQREDETDEAMTEKERARMQRRAERHMRRQRREAAASQAAQLASSQAPEIVSASQPLQVPVGKTESQPYGVAGSSQSLGLSQLPASQVVPGRFGGRPAKKKRKQGF